ncbi:peptidase M48 [Spirochaetia bacterium]|nr:peptidase M48 [Spirochaetia bacterium]
MYTQPIKRTVFACLLSSFAALLLSCAGIAQAIGDSADEMGDSRAARALSQSAHSFERALGDITAEQEYFIGRAVAANLLTNYRYCNERPELTRYLNEITAALVVNSSEPELYNGYHAAILDNLEVNAFATPGGHIFITQGLLDCVSSEDTLAAVIAHEIAHIQLQHSIKAIKTNRVINAISDTTLSIAALTGVLDEAAIEIVTTLHDGYAESQEFAADTLALELLAKAGYEPSSLITVLEALKKNQRSTSGGFNKTHPAPDERIAKLERPLRQYGHKAPDADTRTYREARYNAVKSWAFHSPQ